MLNRSASVMNILAFTFTVNHINIGILHDWASPRALVLDFGRSPLGCLEWLSIPTLVTAMSKGSSVMHEDQNIRTIWNMILHEAHSTLCGYVLTRDRCCWNVSQGSCYIWNMRIRLCQGFQFRDHFLNIHYFKKMPNCTLLTKEREKNSSSVFLKLNQPELFSLTDMMIVFRELVGP